MAVVLKLGCGSVKRACSLVVIKASVAHEVLGLTPRGSKYSKILWRCDFSGRRHSRRREVPINLERFAGSIFEDACIRVFIGVIVRALRECLNCTHPVSKK